MTTRIQIPSFTIGFLIETIFLRITPSHQFIAISSCDYGFDFNDEQLGQELSASLPASITDSVIPEIEADDFDELYKWFLA